MVTTALALHQSVQEFPPPESMGAGLFFSQYERGWYLPAYGLRLRDQRLREYDRHEDNGLWQGGEAGFLTKAANVPWEVTGKGYVMVDRGHGPERVDAVAHFTDVFQQAHFGQGWKYQVKRSGRDYLSQDFGLLWEIIGPGDPSEPLTGAVTGIAVLDSLRCFATGNPTYPILYFSQITGQLHRMHQSRIARTVDMPDGDERVYGNGLCALSRYISFAQQQIYMSRYIVQNLDDKPKPGVNIWSNISDSGVKAALAKYMQETGSDELGPLGKTLNVYSIDPSAPAKLDAITFAVPPEKFDYPTYMDIHVNALALALGIDKQELWELGSGNLGSGQQSEILAQKARGKAFGDFISTLEQLINIRILPNSSAPGSSADVKFAFKYKDEQEEEAQTTKDQALIEIAEGLKRLGFSSTTIANMLADRSETFKELLSNESGQVVVGAVADDAVEPERTAASDTPQLPEAPQAPQIPAVTGAKRFDPSQARDEGGQWDETGAGGGGILAPEKPRLSAPVDQPQDWSNARARDREQYFLDQSDEFAEKLDETETESLFRYTKNASVNDHLREGTIPNSYKEDIARMDSALAKGSLPKKTRLYRGMEGIPPGLEEGSVFQDKGYVSTSLRKDVATGFGDTQMRITAKAGAKGGFLAGDLTSDFDLNEFLLPRDSRFRVTRIEPRDDITVIDVELL